MEKEHLLFLARNYNSLTADEAQELVSIKSTYPYCQLIHSLAARGSRDNELKNSEQVLQLSAVYSTDRSVLKSIMDSPRGKRQELSSRTEPPELIQTNNTLIPSFSDNNLTGDDLLEEIAHDLDRLKELKHEFEISFQTVEKNNPVNKPGAKKIKPKKLEIDEPASDELIKEIKSTKKKIKPESVKQKEQIEIIDQFIKTQPTISSIKEKIAIQTEVTDLTESNQSFGDHIISETLVDILIKQGKKDKALEVLRKLIWKFPQKKAYFAAQIEELKK